MESYAQKYGKLMGTIKAILDVKDNPKLTKEMIIEQLEKVHNDINQSQS